MSASAPTPTGGHFDEISLGTTAAPRRNLAMASPALYSLTHGFSTDEDSGNEEEVEVANHRKEDAAKPTATQATADEAHQRPPPQQCPATEPLALATAEAVPEKEKEQQQQHGQVPEGVQSPPPHQHSPPPIYTTICPPGIYPAVPGQVPCYAAPPLPHGQHPPPAAYIIDPNALNGMPAVLIQAGHHHPCNGHTTTGQPVFIISDPYAEWARRRRALAILTCSLFIFPLLFFLMILLSWSNSFY